MPQLLVRNIEKKVINRLRICAAQDGISMEEEHRRILRSALLGHKQPDKTFIAHLLAIPKASKQEPVDLFKRQRDLPRKIDL